MSLKHYFHSSNGLEKLSLHAKIFGKNFHWQWKKVQVKIMARVGQRGGRCPTPGNIQGQAGRGSEQPD